MVACARPVTLGCVSALQCRYSLNTFYCIVSSGQVLDGHDLYFNITLVTGNVENNCEKLWKGKTIICYISTKRNVIDFCAIRQISPDRITYL